MGLFSRFCVAQAVRHAVARHQDQYGSRGFFPIEQMQLMKFDGESWRLFGEVIDGEVGH